MKKATLICDLQFGSTGKGLIAGYLAERDKPDVVVTAWSMNAGHTYINGAGRKFVHCMLANGIVSPNIKYILIGPGSQIGIHKLIEEMHDCADLLRERSAVVLIHENACVISRRHIDEENGGATDMTGIGSTKKGCGAALIEKIRRSTGQPSSPITASGFAPAILEMAGMRGLDNYIAVINNAEYQQVLRTARRIQIEGAQGYSLGINSGFYPFTTSRECTPAQIASDCSVPIQMVEKVVGTMRTLPIRVANRYDEKGKQIGYSGPCYSDQRELSWDEVKQQVELTTVTKLPRRIFTFSHQQAEQALFACRPDEVFLNFANYLSPQELWSLAEDVDQLAKQNGGCLSYLGYGPAVGDVARYLTGTGPGSEVIHYGR